MTPSPDRPPSDSPKKKSRSLPGRVFVRTALPYLIAAAIASGLMGWYFLLYVPAKLEYFAGLRFRTLAVAGGQIKSKIENLSKSFSGGVTNVAVGQAADYFRVLLPELRTGVPEAFPESSIKSSGPTFVDKGLAGRVSWNDVARAAAAASTRDFDDLVLATADGHVVWQRERTTMRIGNLKELLSAPSAEGGWLPLNWNVQETVLVAKPEQQLSGTVGLKPVNLGGIATAVFIQAVRITPDGVIRVGATDANDARLFVAGLVGRTALQRQAMHIPAAWVVLFSLPVILLFLALPFVKLATLMPKERYGFVDIVLLATTTVFLSGIGAILPFVPAAVGKTNDAQLEELATAIGQQFADETVDVLKLASAIRRAKNTPNWLLHQCAVSVAGSTGSAPAVDNRCRLWRALSLLNDRYAGDPPKGVPPGITPGSLELDVVVWVNRLGEQELKWTTKAVVTGPTRHGDFQHFKDLMAGHTWKLNDAVLGREKARVAAEDHAWLSAAKFTIEPLRTPTTSELGVVFAIDAAPPESFLVLNVRPHSVVDPIVPPGFGFAVLAPTGRVLFHSDDALGLEENFVEEVGDPAYVRQQSAAGHVVTWSGDYHGRPHRLHMQPLSSFQGNDWRIVTFLERDRLLATRIQHESGVLRLGAVSLAFQLLAGCAWWAVVKVRRRHVRDLLPSFLSSYSPWTRALVGVSLFATVMVWAASWRWTQGALDLICLFFVVLPFIAVGIATWRRRDVPGTGHARLERRHAIEIGLLVFLIGAAPAAGFARLVQQVQDVDVTERWLADAAEHWNARRTRLLDRVNGPAYHSLRTGSVWSDRHLLTQQGGFAADWQGDRPGRDQRYSYLPIARVDQSSTMPSGKSSREPRGGQTRLRWILALTPLNTKDEPGPSHAMLDVTAGQLRFPPAGPGQPVLAVSAGVDSRADWSVANVIVGLFLLGGAIVAVCWAHGKLASPSLVIRPTLSALIDEVQLRNLEAILFIGAPHTEKDRHVADVVTAKTGHAPDDRIQLLDATLTDQAIAKHVDRVNWLAAKARQPAGSAARLWIHVSNLEAQLATVESRTQVRLLLEGLRTAKPGAPPRVLIVTSSVDPIANFEEIFDTERRRIYRDVLPEVALNQAALSMTRFRRCYMLIAARRRRRNPWPRWLHYSPRAWRGAVRREVAGYPPLAYISGELRGALPGKSSLSLPDLARAVAARADGAYQFLWTSCTRSEKLVLVQLAQEGLVNPKSWDVAAQLVARGLIVERPAPAIFNYTFRGFLQRIERNHVVTAWERMEGTGLWMVAGRLIAGALILGGGFYLLTQGFSVQSLVPIVSGTGVFGIPFVKDLLARVSGGRAGGAGASA